MIGPFPMVFALGGSAVAGIGAFTAVLGFLFGGGLLALLGMILLLVAKKHFDVPPPQRW